MSRPTKQLRKKFVVFCEGDTEYNCLAKFIIVDADRIHNGKEETAGFMELINVCTVRLIASYNEKISKCEYIY